MIITVGGFAGSGKSTVADIVAKKLGWGRISAGDVFRKLAKEKEMLLEDFNEYAEEHPEIDRELDKKILKTAEEGKAIIDGRLIGLLTKKNGISCITVWLDAPLEVRAKRIVKRENKDYQTVIKEIQRRETSDRQRFWDLYTIDINDLSGYSLVIDTTYKTPEEIAAILLKKLEDDNVVT